MEAPVYAEADDAAAPDMDAPAYTEAAGEGETEIDKEYRSFRRVRKRLKRIVNRTMRLDPETWDMPSGKKKRKKMRRKKLLQYKKARRAFARAADAGARYFSEELCCSLQELEEKCGQLRVLLRPLQKGKGGTPAEIAEDGAMKDAGDRELIAWLSADILAIRNELNRQIKEHMDALTADE